MGGKVIKFNLMGAIGVFIIIIVAIAGITIFINKKWNNNNNNNQNQNTIQEDKTSYKELDKKEIVTINGIDKEITLRTYEREYLYKIDYDIDSFYIDDRDTFKQYLESQISDTIQIEISELNDFASKRNELETSGVERKELNGHECYLEIQDDDKNVLRNYYIQDGSQYYAIRIKCGKEFADTTLPIIEKMIETFKIM